MKSDHVISGYETYYFIYMTDYKPISVDLYRTLNLLRIEKPTGFRASFVEHPCDSFHIHCPRK